MRSLILVLFFISVYLVLGSPLEDGIVQEEYIRKTSNLKDINFKQEYDTSKRKKFKLNMKPLKSKYNLLLKNMNSKMLKIVLENSEFEERIKAKAFSRDGYDIRGKVLYIYKDYIKNDVYKELKGDKKVYVFTTFIDKKILKNRRLRLNKYMENMQIQQNGVSDTEPYYERDKHRRWIRRHLQNLKPAPRKGYKYIYRKKDYKVNSEEIRDLPRKVNKIILYERNGRAIFRMRK